jgi:hypothetical protein
LGPDRFADTRNAITAQRERPAREAPRTGPTVPTLRGRTMSLHMLPDGTRLALAPMPAPTPPSDPMGATEPGNDVHALITVRVALTRDMLAVALEDAAALNYDEHPDSWSISYIRESVELYVAQTGYLRLLESENLLSDFLETEPPGEARDRAQAVYRAVDRAYPRPRQDRMDRLNERQDRIGDDPAYRLALVERLRAACTGSCFDEGFGR